MDKEYQNIDNYRDELKILGERGKRLWVYARKPKGRLHRLRILVTLVLLLVFFGTPFISYQGEPFMLINVLDRKFILFGKIFWTQDSHLFFLMMISAIVFIILFTVVYGRLFCGWVCPQTVFVEMIFRKIEYLIEGNENKQRSLDNGPLSFEKLLKKTLKHSAFWIVAFIFSTTLLSYFVGVDQVLMYAKDGISAHKAGFVTIFIFSTVVYLVFAKLRELVCIVACPYGRLQGVLLDSNSIIVSYDFKRGEPRSKPKSSEADRGDCIDCLSCLYVCPTGIDIRNGTQLECTNCTACIDACNGVMQRIDKPKSLIRFSSSRSIKEGVSKILTLRSVAYTFVLLCILGFLSYLLISRTDVESTILRTQGLLFQEQQDNKISNLYNIKILNKTRIELPIHLKIISHEGEIVHPSGGLKVKGGAVAEGVFFVYLDKKQVVNGKNEIEIAIYANDKLIETIETTFLGP